VGAEDGLFYRIGIDVNGGPVLLEEFVGVEVGVGLESSRVWCWKVWKSTHLLVMMVVGGDKSMGIRRRARGRFGIGCALYLHHESCYVQNVF
jgi:hypothetical protein